MAHLVGRAALTCVFFVLATGGAAGYAASTGLSIWAGAYSVEQAKRGKVAYATHCATCHGAALTGGEAAPPLTGSVFLNNWNHISVGDLFQRIHNTMPASNPGSLSGRTVSDIEAFIFQTSGYPAGALPLPTDPQMMEDVSILATKPRD